jgi:hypothetical protein
LRHFPRAWTTYMRIWRNCNFELGQWTTHAIIFDLERHNFRHKRLLTLRYAYFHSSLAC